MSVGVRVVVLGPPGAGKGTQAMFLKERFGACHISTGDILRKAVNDQSPLGMKAKNYMNKGKLVTDNLILELMGEHLSQEDCKCGFVLDGFPRTRPQALGLEKLLKNLGLQLDCVVFLNIPRDAIIRRLAGRRICEKCGSLYHLVFDPPSKEGVCDRCHGVLYQRSDDKEDTIAARYDVYKTQTAPFMIDYYREGGLLHEIDGLGNLDEVKGRVFQALGLDVA